jgi:hypothetical protein
MSSIRWVAIVVSIMLFVVSCAGTRSGAIIVSIVDAERQAVPGAMVTISNDRVWARKFRALADKKGEVHFPILPSKSGYAISIDALGCDTFHQGDITVKSGVSLNLEAVLGFDLCPDGIDHDRMRVHGVPVSGGE